MTHRVLMEFCEAKHQVLCISEVRNFVLYFTSKVHHAHGDMLPLNSECCVPSGFDFEATDDSFVRYCSSYYFASRASSHCNT